MGPPDEGLLSPPNIPKNKKPPSSIDSKKFQKNKKGIDRDVHPTN